MFENFLTETTAMVLNAVTTIIAAAMPVAIAFGANYLRKRFGLEISKAQQGQLAELAEQAVLTTSQVLRSEPGSTKREAAVRQLQKRASEVGLKLANDAAGELVEASVDRLKRLRNAL